MKTILLANFFLCFILQEGYSQAPSIEWQKCLGGSSSDKAYSIKRTVDGGYITASSVYSNDGDVTGNHGADMWLTKLDASGNIEWQKCFGGSSNDSPYEVQQTNDLGYIMAGWTISNDGDVSGYHGNFDWWVVKTDSIGSLQWQKCFGGTGDPNGEYVFGELAHSIVQTNDNGFAVCGSTNSTDGDVTCGNAGDIGWTIKLDTLGNIQWEHCDLNWEAPASKVRQTTDNGFIIIGNFLVEEQPGHFYSEGYISKLDSSGNLQWHTTYGGSRSDAFNSIEQTLDDGYIIAGSSNSNDGDVTGHHGSTFYSDCWVLKLDSLGTIQWQKSLGGTSGDVGNSVQQTNDHGYIVGGSSTSSDGDVSGNHGGNDFWIVKLDSTGIIQWQECLGGSGSESCNSIDITTDEGYILAGSTTSNDFNVSGNHGSDDVWVVKLQGCNNVCPAPTSFASTNISSTHAKANWNTNICAVGYKLRYRPVGTITWMTKNVNSNTGSKKLTNLNTNTQYEWQVRTKCSTNPLNSAWSSSNYFTTSLRLDDFSEQEIELSLFPNPAGDELNIHFENSSPLQKLIIQNTIGQIVYENVSFPEQNFTQSIDISQLPKGMYYVIGISGEQIISKIFVKN